MVLKTGWKFSDGIMRKAGSLCSCMEDKMEDVVILSADWLGCGETLLSGYKYGENRDF